MKKIEMTNKTKTTVSILIFATFLAVGWWIWNISHSEIKDCGQDGVCFREALKNCERAKVITDFSTIPWFLPEYSEEFKRYGMVRISADLQTYAEIKKGNPDECTVYMDVNIKKPSLLVRLILFFHIDSFIELELDTGDMTCTGSTDELFDEHFQYRLFDYCKGRLLRSFDINMLEYWGKKDMFWEEIYKIEDKTWDLDPNEIVSAEIVIPDIFSSVTYNEEINVFVYTGGYPEGGLIDSVIPIGPLPVEEGVYKLELRKNGNLTEVLSAKRIDR